VADEVTVRFAATSDIAPTAQRDSRAVRGLREDLGELGRSGRTFDGLSRSTLNWSGALGHVQRQASGVTQTVDRMTNRAVVGLGAVTGGAVTWGLRTASSFELSRTAYGTLLRDVDKGNRLFEQLQTYNLSTPFDLRGISAAEQTLLQFRIAGDKALPVLKGLGDVAALTQDPTENLQRMAVALGQISSAGVLRAQDLNQLVQAGFPAYELLSELSGRTSAQLRKDMETGLTLPADRFVDAVATMQGRTLEVYRGGAARQADTLYGQWTNFKDQLAMNLAAGLEPSLPQIKAELPVLAHSLADAISEMAPLMPDLIDSAVRLAPAATQLAGALADVTGEVAPLVADIADLMGPDGVKALLGVLLGYRALRGVTGTVKTFTEALVILRGVEAGTGVGGAAGAAGRRVGPGAPAVVAGRVGAAGAVGGALAPQVLKGFKRPEDLNPFETVFGGTVGMALRSGVDAWHWTRGAVGLDRGKSAQELAAARAGRPAARGHDGAAALTAPVNVNVGVINARSDIDVERAIARGTRRALAEHVRERQARGGGS
jgi:tape measure domain-containing protein